ncbi:MAG: hypothetical protein AAFX08_08810 [Pseudomonadota bacterium]
MFNARARSAAVRHRRAGLNFLFALFGGVLLAGCVTEETLALKEDPAYVRGFGDGCVTVSEREKSFSTKVKRDEYEFENSRAYRAGWRQGYQQCKDPIPEAETGGRILGEEGEF